MMVGPVVVDECRIMGLGVVFGCKVGLGVGLGVGVDVDLDVGLYVGNSVIGGGQVTGLLVW